MDRPRWPVIAALAVVGVFLAVGGWAIGRSRNDASNAAADGGGSATAIRLVGGVPVGVLHTRAGALAAADNYVATSSETVLQDPNRYEQLVRRAYAQGYQARALREGRQVRAASPTAMARYEAGAKAIALIAARRLDSYDGSHAVVSTWRSGVVWGGDERAEARWFLTRTQMVWNSRGWLVDKVDDVQRPAPAPVLVYNDPDALKASAFERDLRGMTAPTYGVAR